MGNGVADGDWVCVGVGMIGVHVGVEVRPTGSSVASSSATRSSSMGGGEESKDKSIVGVVRGVFVGFSVFVSWESDPLFDEDLGSGMNNEQAIVMITIGNNKRTRIFAESGFIGLPTLLSSTI